MLIKCRLGGLQYSHREHLLVHPSPTSYLLQIDPQTWYWIVDQRSGFKMQHEVITAAPGKTRCSGRVDKTLSAGRPIPRLKQARSDAGCPSRNGQLYLPLQNSATRYTSYHPSYFDRLGLYSALVLLLPQSPLHYHPNLTI